MNALADFLKAQAPNKPVADVLADIFRKRIMDGEYLPGERLVEADLTKLYGVSRGPIREAIRRLIAEGLVEAEKHRSPTVKGLDQAQFEEMFEIRGVLEGYGAALAARNVTDGAKCKALNEEAQKWRSGAYASAPEIFVAANTRFHEEIGVLANRELLATQIRMLAIPGYKAVFEPLLKSEEMERSSIDHADILELIAKGDATAAEARMRSHVQNSGSRVGAKYSDQLFDRRLRELERLRGLDSFKSA